MSYIEASLAPGEQLIYRAHFHWFYRACAYGALIISAVIALFTFDTDHPWAAIVALAVGVIVFLLIMIPIWSTEIGVTSQRIVFKRGFIERETNELQLTSIEQVEFNQDFWGRIFGYGRIELHGTGDDDIKLPAVADPLGLRAALQQAIGAVRGENGNGNGQHHVQGQGTLNPRPA